MKDDESIYSDFWLDKKSLSNYDKNTDEGFSVDLIELSSYRKLVSNFVFILTHLDIPVKFKVDEKGAGSTNGDVIYLSSSIRKRSDFDWSIGLALHEASHILLTDFDLVNSIFSKVPVKLPQNIKEKAKKKNLIEKEIYNLSKWVFNFIEDRYIDSYVFKNAPGYRGYYKSLYEKMWNNENISKVMESSSFRTNDLISYEFRLINLTNPKTDLNALPSLKEIFDLIDLENITRLKTTNKRMELSNKIVEIIIDNITEQNKKDSSNITFKVIHKKLSSVDNQDEEIEISENIVDKIHDNLSENFSEEEIEEIKNEFQKQINFVEHNYEDLKENITEKEESILTVIENSNLMLSPIKIEDNSSIKHVNCILVKKLTKELIDEGRPIFPLSSSKRYLKSSSLPKLDNEQAVNKGFQLGKILGKKLKIRNEENVTKLLRKSTGKIEKRLISEIGFGNENIFTKSILQKYNKFNLHVSIDSSSSMDSKEKWCPTLTCIVSLCVAASMIENFQISVSLRSGITNKNSELPFIVLIYDSKVDKISKIRKLFPFLEPFGSTPEGLTFPSILKEFINSSNNKDEDTYFLNISDGEPAYLYNDGNTQISYIGEKAACHTKLEVNKMRRKGIKILSYFISSDGVDSYNLKSNKSYKDSLKELFKKMYGKDGKFINVNDVNAISNSINKLLINEEI